MAAFRKESSTSESLDSEWILQLSTAYPEDQYRTVSFSAFLFHQFGKETKRGSRRLILDIPYLSLPLVVTRQRCLVP